MAFRVIPSSLRIVSIMFERYTEKARRAIFFARYECCNYGSEEIESEHLLLGLLRETALLQRLLKTGRESLDRKSTRLNSSHANISYAVFCLKKKKKINRIDDDLYNHVDG